MQNLNEKTFDSVLLEAKDYFEAQGVSILGDGYKEIASTPALFESYVSSLTEGTSADNCADMTQLMENTNSVILHENSLTGIQPISSLSMPVIRKLWPKFALKDAMRTQVAKSPRFTISYTKPYMLRGEEKVYLPQGLADRSNFNALTAAGQKDYVVAEAKLTNGAALNVDFTKQTSGAASVIAKVSEVDVNKVVVPAADTPSRIKRQPLDELYVENVVWEFAFGMSEKQHAEVIVEKFGPLYDQAGTLVPASKVQDEHTYFTAPEKIGRRLDVTGSAIYDLKNGQLVVKFDGAKDLCTLALVGADVEGVKIAAGAVLTMDLRAGVSTEYNENAWDVGFDILRQDIDIPTGQHINAPLPIEFLNDAMATYQIDATKEVVDIMTNVCAMRLDLEALDFIIDSYTNLPSNEAFQDPQYGDSASHTVYFDCIPQPGFAGTPKAWREQIRASIDYLAQQIKNETYLGTGQFKIVCNPLDAQLISNVNWEFQGAANSVDGVAVDYSVGTFTGANFYSVISSVNVPQGQMYVMFLPESNTQMTYCYYPYSFASSMGYVSSNRSRTPSLMMTKRHTFAEFMPAVGCVMVLNNTGNPYAKYVKVANTPEEGGAWA